MKAFKIFLMTVLLSIFSNPIFAQHDLTEEDKIELQDRVKNKVEEFLYYFSDIVNIKLSDMRRKNSITSALALFIGKGEAYSVKNEYGEIEKHSLVRM